MRSLRVFLSPVCTTLYCTVLYCTVLYLCTTPWAFSWVSRGVDPPTSFPGLFPWRWEPLPPSREKPWERGWSTHLSGSCFQCPARVSLMSPCVILYKVVCAPQGVLLLGPPYISFSQLPSLFFAPTLKGHSHLWDRAYLDTSFLTLKIVHLKLKYKIRAEYI